MSTTPNIPLDLLEKAIAAIELDPLNLSPEVEALVRQNPALSELRVQWLAMEDAPLPLAPAGYFQALPGRVLRKLPTRTVIPHRPVPALWAAAAALMLAVGVGGFWAGKANRIPLEEAHVNAPVEPSRELPVADAPFQDSDDTLVQIQSLSPDELRHLADKVQKGQQ